MRIILDAMGGDNAPLAPVMGAVQAANDFGAQITLVGKGNEIWLELPLDVDTVRAQNIVKYANDNYRFFNGGNREDKTDPFGPGGI